MKEIRRCLIFFHPGKNSMLTCLMLNIQILFTNYDITTDFLNLAFCSEHFISTGIKHRILATLNINKKFNSDSLCAFNTPHQKLNSSKYQITTHLLLFHIVTTTAIFRNHTLISTNTSHPMLNSGASEYLEHI